MKCVTYGPFPGGWPESFEPDFAQITAAGFNAIRLYEMPDLPLLDAAWRHGLRVFGGLKWQQTADFIERGGLEFAAAMSLEKALNATRKHPALAGIYVGNEVPADLVRWMGPLKVRQVFERLITLGKQLAPDLLFAYANYPTTEYLEPENADFTAFNLYLEDPEALRCYLRRLHHIAGDRPLVISEFGLDSRRNGRDRQAETLRWAVQAAADLECAGVTLYAWSDRWWNNGAPVEDWDFGLLDRKNAPKPFPPSRFLRPRSPPQPQSSSARATAETASAPALRRFASLMAATLKHSSWTTVPTTEPLSTWQKISLGSAFFASRVAA
jgi:hypothetical protein